MVEEPERRAAPIPTRTREDDALRHAGIVLIVIGLLASVAAIAWNRSRDFPERDELVGVEGVLERIHLESFRSRTSETKFVVFDVAMPGGEEGTLDHWVLPDTSIRFEGPLSTLGLGEPVRGWVESQERLVRGADYPIRILWSIEQRGQPVIPYALVREVEERVVFQSPWIGVMTATIGALFLVLWNALRRKRPGEGASAVEPQR